MLKLSEAMRLGAMMVPQAFDVRGEEIVIERFYNILHLETAQYVTACALQSALIAIGRPGEHSVYEVWPWAYEYTTVECHACGSCYAYVAVLVVHLNDDHHMSRQSIADFVEGLEKEYAPPSIDVLVEEECLAHFS